MQQHLLIAVLGGLGGMLGWGFADFFAKKTIDEIGDVASLVWAHVFGTITFAILAIITAFSLKYNIAIPDDSTSWALLIFFGALQATVYLLTYKGFGKGQLAVLNPIFASYSGLTAVISIIVFGELLTGHLLLVIMTIFAGILLTSIDMEGLRSKKLNLNIGVKEVGLAAILAAFWTISWDKFVTGKDWLTYAFLMYSFMTLTAILVGKFQNVKLGPIKPGIWKFLILIGVCETVAYLGISLAFSSSPFTSIIALISGAFSLPTIILSRIFLKEKVTTIQTFGSLLIIAGIVIISILH